MSEPFIGEIIMFAGNFAPRGWALCAGQLLPIAQNTALFSILGTTYGGDGRVTFALPDFRGRLAIAPGQGPGLTPRTLGEQSGSESVSLIITEMPAHNHILLCNTSTGDSDNPANNVPGLCTDGTNRTPVNAYTATPNANMAVNSVSVSGGSQPHENMQPYTCVNFIIAIEGIFPSRN